MITFKGLFKKTNHAEAIVVISGLPRSGTSMLMKMPIAGGVELFTDDIRKPNEDNPKGYFELEKVKALHEDTDKLWLGDAKGKAIKVISYLLRDLPETFCYKVIFLNRNLAEVNASQKRMLIRKGQSVDPAEDEEAIRVQQKHLMDVQDWLEQESDFDVLYVEHREVIKSPLHQARRICEFLDRKLDVERMVDVVDPQLYRNRLA